MVSPKSEVSLTGIKSKTEKEPSSERRLTLKCQDKENLEVRPFERIELFEEKRKSMDVE